MCIRDRIVSVEAELHRRLGHRAIVVPVSYTHLDVYKRQAYRNKFSGKYDYRLITGGVGHNLPQEAPQAFAQAVIDADGY